MFLEASSHDWFGLHPTRWQQRDKLRQGFPDDFLESNDRQFIVISTLYKTTFVNVFKSGNHCTRSHPERISSMPTAWRERREMRGNGWVDSFAWLAFSFPLLSASPSLSLFYLFQLPLFISSTTLSTFIAMPGHPLWLHPTRQKKEGKRMDRKHDVVLTVKQCQSSE